MEPEPEKPRRGKKPRITVSRIEEPEPAQLPALGTNGIQALVESPQQLQLVLDSLKDVDQMHTLHEQVAAWQDLQKRMAAATQTIVQIATVRLKLERKIGEHLAQTVHQGRPSKRSDNLTFSESARLPEGINKQRASWYRSIARVPEEVFEAFLADRASKGKPPSATALLKCVPKPQPEQGRAPRRPDRHPLPAASQANQGVDRIEAVNPSADVLDAVARLMDVDVVIGDVGRSWPTATHVDPDALKPGQVFGNVFVAHCPEPSTWLPKLARARSDAKLSQVVVVLPPVHWAEWFKQLEAGGWFCCFTPHAIVAYCGERTHAFKVTFDEMGAVLRSSE